MGLNESLATEVRKTWLLVVLEIFTCMILKNVSQSDLETCFYYSVDSINQYHSQVLTNKL
jgi:hypothetical protein